MKEATAVGLVSFLLACLLFSWAVIGIRALVYAVVPEEALPIFFLSAPVVLLFIVVLIDIMKDNFREKKAVLEEYNRLNWQKERLQMSLEERMWGSV